MLIAALRSLDQRVPIKTLVRTDSKSAVQTRTPIVSPESKPLGSSPVIEIAKGNIGYEELDLTISAFEGFDLSKVATKPASLLLRRWREQRSWEDLAFYVLGAQLTIHAIEAALH